MLEKARMKGKKGTGGVTTQARGEAGEEFEDDGLCCTCGQQVGQQHNHVSGNNNTGGQKVNSGGGGGGQGHVQGTMVKGK